MNRHEEDRLLNDMVAGEEISDFRHASLEHGLALLRQRRRRRRAMRACVLAGLPLALAAGLLVQRAVLTPGQPVSTASSNAPSGPLALATPPPPVKFITDEELFALFPGRPLALVGPPGRQQLIFLDEAVDNASE